jgi:DNA primase
MRFTPQFLDELRARLPVSEVVGKRVKLRKAGREWKGLSPFQQEKTPSFTVNDQKQFYHDVSTGKHGNIFDFVMETEGVSFPEAVERLASMAGMPVPAATPDAARHEQRRKTLHDVMELAAKFFGDTLASRHGAKARGYLADRAISAATQVQLPHRQRSDRRTFCPASILNSHSSHRGQLVEAPAGRLPTASLFPTIASGPRDVSDHDARAGDRLPARALEKGCPGKNTRIRRKRRCFTRATISQSATARQATHNGAPPIVVEGYVDVIAMVTTGFPRRVAAARHRAHRKPARAALKMADEPISVSTATAPGRRRPPRAADPALPHLKPGKSLRFRAAARGQGP